MESYGGGGSFERGIPVPCWLDMRDARECTSAQTRSARFSVAGVGFRVNGSGFGVEGLGFKVQG